MKNLLSVLLILALTFLNASMTFADDHAEMHKKKKDHSHGHSHHSSSDSDSMTMDQGKKWATDKPLRSNMRAIRSVIKTNKDKIHNKKMTDAEYKKLATSIQKSVDGIFKECKLPKKADAQLHVILANILKGKNLIETSKSDKMSGVIVIHKSLAMYGKFFDDPKW